MEGGGEQNHPKNLDKLNLRKIFAATRSGEGGWPFNKTMSLIILLFFKNYHNIFQYNGKCLKTFKRINLQELKRSIYHWERFMSVPVKNGTLV